MCLLKVPIDLKMSEYLQQAARVSCPTAIHLTYVIAVDRAT